MRALELLRDIAAGIAIVFFLGCLLLILIGMTPTIAP